MIDKSSDINDKLWSKVGCPWLSGRSMLEVTFKRLAALFEASETTVLGIRKPKPKPGKK